MTWYEVFALSLLLAGVATLVIWWARAPRFAGARATTRRATRVGFRGMGRGLAAAGRGIGRGGRWLANSHRVRNAARWAGSNIPTVLAIVATAFIVWWILHRMGVVGEFIWFTLLGWAVMVTLVSMWAGWLAPRQVRERLNLQLYGDDGVSVAYDESYRRWRERLGQPGANTTPPPITPVAVPQSLWGRIRPIAINNDWLFYVPFLMMFFCLFVGIGEWAAGHRPEGLWDIASRQWLQTGMGQSVCQGWQRVWALPVPGAPNPCAPIYPKPGEFGTWFWFGAFWIYLPLCVPGFFLAFRDEWREIIGGVMRRASERRAARAQSVPAQAGNQPAGGGGHQHPSPGAFLLLEGFLDFVASFAAEYAANRAVRGRLL